jgi:hypothetical protein
MGFQVGNVVAIVIDLAGFDGHVISSKSRAVLSPRGVKLRRLYF